MAKRKIGSISNCKGNAITDSLVLIVLVFAFILFGIIANMVFNDINTDVQADDDINASVKAKVQDLNTRFPSFFDGLFLFFLILMWALVIVASFNIDAHPIFFIVTIVLLIFVFLVGGEIGNVYEEITADSEISTIAAGFPISNWIMSHFLIVIIVIGFSIVLVLFGKSQGWFNG
jgi:hypothetical protein